jgi:nucleotide-binding universal stress UspA family protein
MKTPAKILVPTDMSAFSLEGLRYAQEIAGLFNAEIIVLYVGDKGKKEHATREGRIPDADEIRIRKNLVHFLMDHNAVQHNLQIEVRYGSPANEIVKAAKEFHTDLIVISTHGRTGLQHVLVGSVTERVVRSSSVPVLTVKPRELVEFITLTEEDVASDLHLN